MCTVCSLYELLPNPDTWSVCVLVTVNEQQKHRVLVVLELCVVLAVLGRESVYPRATVIGRNCVHLYISDSHFSVFALYA